MKDMHILHPRRILNFLIDLIFPEPKIAQTVRQMSGDDFSRLPQATAAPDNAYCLWSYQDPVVREIIWQIKYYENKALLDKITPYLASLVSAEILDTHADSSVALIPIPLSKKRLAERGYNQADNIAQVLYAYLKSSNPALLYMNTLITKDIHTESQTRKNKVERSTNLADTFSIHVTHISIDTTIILVDDVITTGATTNEIIRILRSAGFKRIYRVAIAH